MDLSQTSETWCIEDTLFYPLGLITHNTYNKTVHVTWNDKYLMNFISKKIGDNIHKFNKFVISFPEKVLDVIILKVNTLLLLASGAVCYFSSIKSIQSIPWLSRGVRCISKSVGGFSLIRISNDCNIHLEVYKDVHKIGEYPQQCIKSFDLTFDEETLFYSGFNDQKITLISVQITDKNRKFIELLLKKVNFEALEIHVFSVSKNLFALYVKEEEGYEIVTLTSQVCVIELVKFLDESNMLLVLLNSGLIEIWYLSKIAFVIEKYTYMNGRQLIHHTFFGNVLFFTDEQTVSRLIFSYNAEQHICQVEEKSVHAVGILAVTYDEVSGKLICLSNNNIFYLLTFKDDEDIKRINTVMQDFDLSNQKVPYVLDKAIHLNRIISIPERMNNLIEEEYSKQELISVCKKSVIYSDLVSAMVSYSENIPATECLYYPLDRKLTSFYYFAVLSIKILSHELFKSKVWKLIVSDFSHIRIIAFAQEIFKKRINFLIPIKRKNPPALVPDFKIQLLTHVSIDKDFVCINIPVKVRVIDLIKLFSCNQRSNELKIKMDFRKSLYSFEQTNLNFDAGHFCNAFGLPDLCEDIYFIGEKLAVFLSTTKVHIEGFEPVAVYYGKICLSKYFWRNFEQSTDICEVLHRKLLGLQCKIGRYYEPLKKKELNFSYLKTIYEEFRNEIIFKF